MKLQANAVRSTQPRSTQMPNCDFVFNRHTEHRFQLSRAVMRFLQPNQPTLANLVPAAHLHSMPLRAKCDFGLWDFWGLLSIFIGTWGQPQLCVSFEQAPTLLRAEIFQLWCFEQGTTHYRHHDPLILCSMECAHLWVQICYFLWKIECVHDSRK